LMNGLLRLILHRGWADRDYIAAHTLGLEHLERVVDAYPVDRVADLCGLKFADIERAAELLGAAERLLSTVLQDLYHRRSSSGYEPAYRWPASGPWSRSCSIWANHCGRRVGSPNTY